MPTDPSRLARARESLEGLSVGDAFGKAAFHQIGQQYGVASHSIAPGPWRYTDDTLMALSIYENLRLHGQIEPDALAGSFAAHYSLDRGYGRSMHGQIARLRAGESWRRVSIEQFGGQGSYGNGSAMRVPPLGAYFADDLVASVRHAESSAIVTHSHPEGIAGAIATALAASAACRLRGQNTPGHAAFIDSFLPLVPASEVKMLLGVARDLPAETDLRVAAQTLGDSSQITCPDTVPLVLWLAGRFLDDYETALWNTVAIGGDIDTTCAIVGGIVACFTGADDIPEEWLARRESLPGWALGSEAI